MYKKLLASEMRCRKCVDRQCLDYVPTPLSSGSESPLQLDWALNFAKANSHELMKLFVQATDYGEMGNTPVII